MNFIKITQRITIIFLMIFTQLKLYSDIDEKFFHKYSILRSRKLNSGADYFSGLIFAKYFLEELNQKPFSLTNRLEIIKKMVSDLIKLGKDNAIKGASRGLGIALMPNSNSIENFKAVQDYLLTDILNLNNDDFFINLKEYIAVKKNEYNYKNLYLLEENLSKNSKDLLSLFKLNLKPFSVIQNNNFFNFAKYIFSVRQDLLDDSKIQVYDPLLKNPIFNELKKLELIEYSDIEKTSKNPDYISKLPFAVMSDPFLLLYLIIFDTQDKLFEMKNTSNVEIFKKEIEQISKSIYFEKVSMLTSLKRSLISFVKQNAMFAIGGLIVKSIYDSSINFFQAEAIKKKNIWRAWRLIRASFVPSNFSLPIDQEANIKSLINKIKRGISFPFGGILFHGAPGNGKTSIVNYIARSSDVSVMTITPADLNYDPCYQLDLYFNAAKAFADKNKKVILFFDDADYLLAQRIDNGSEGKERLMIQMLSLIESITKSGYKNKIYLFAATNYINKIDEAASRAGRLGSWILINNPTKEEAVNLCKAHLNLDSLPTSQFNIFCKKGICLFSRADLSSACVEVLQSGEVSTKSLQDILKIRLQQKG